MKERVEQGKRTWEEQVLEGQKTSGEGGKKTGLAEAQDRVHFYIHPCFCFTVLRADYEQFLMKHHITH